MISSEELYGIVNEEINQTSFPPERCRCHEMARIIAPGLRRRGFNVELGDGVVEYDTRSLFTSHFLALFDPFTEIEREILEECIEKAGNTLLVAHSWCDVKQKENIIVVDSLPNLTVHSVNIVLSWILTVEEKDKLPHIYRPVGRTFGRWLIIPREKLPYIKRLRI